MQQNNILLLGHLVEFFVRQEATKTNKETNKQKKNKGMGKKQESEKK